MKIPRNLRTIEKVHLASIDRFFRDFSTVSTSSSMHSIEASVSYAVVNLLNCWANFMRMYYVSCAQGAVSPSGGHVTSNLSGAGRTFNDIIGEAILNFKRSAVPRSNGVWDGRDEPPWHASSTLLALATAHGFSNLPDITAAFTFGYTAHKDLVVFRNYFGHKNLNTVRKAQGLASRYSIQSNLRPTQILMLPPSGSTQPLLNVWKTEICDTISYLCS
jgi:hypothetical protein